MKIFKNHELFQRRGLEIFQNFHEIFKYFKVNTSSCIPSYACGSDVETWPRLSTFWPCHHRWPLVHLQCNIGAYCTICQISINE